MKGGGEGEEGEKWREEGKGGGQKERAKESGWDGGKIKGRNSKRGNLLLVEWESKYNTSWDIFDS